MTGCSIHARPTRLIARTVATVGPHPDPMMVNSRDERLWLVTYTEPPSQEWGSGNTCLASTWWLQATPSQKEGSA